MSFLERGGGGKSFLEREKKKKKTRHEISSTPLIPCPHLPAFHTHTPPCSTCDHPCRWTEPSRTFQNALHGIRTHKHARTCTPLPSAQYTHRFYCDVRGCIDSPVDKLEFFLCCLSLSLSLSASINHLPMENHYLQNAFGGSLRQGLKNLRRGPLRLSCRAPREPAPPSGRVFALCWGRADGCPRIAPACSIEKRFSIPSST